MRWPHPPVTLAIVAAYAAVHVLAAIVGPPRFDAGSFAFSPRLALQRRGWHRLFASHFFHLSLFHLLVNASSTLALGSQLERRNGSRWLALTTLGAVAGTSAFHLLLALGWSRLGRALAGRGGAGAAAVLDAKSAGFSGVLFHYVVLEVAESRGGARALFGLASVPDRWYPWALYVFSLVLFACALSSAPFVCCVPA
jgi:membrane associated rhomboid family serine protease